MWSHCLPRHRVTIFQIPFFFLEGKLEVFVPTLLWSEAESCVQKDYKIDLNEELSTWRGVFLGY